MKNLILISAIYIASVFSVQAQQTATKPAPTAEQKTEKMLTALTTACNLTPDQVTKAKPIVAEVIQARMANKQKLSADKVKLKAANQTALNTMNTKMNALLNADQQAKLITFEKAKKAEAKKRTTTTEIQQ